MLEREQVTGIDNPDELAGMAAERSGLYRLLATIFRTELTAELLARLLDPDFQKDLAGAGVDTGSLSTLNPDETLLEELAVEFSRLFMGPGKHVSPYESVHMGGDGGTLWGPRTSAVKKFIEQSGFAYDKEYHDLPDHISVELEFMAHLTEQEAEAWETGDQENAVNCLRFQKEFMDRHLGLWVGRFADQVIELGEMPVYPQMAILARDFVDAESQELNLAKDIQTPVN